MVDADVGAVEAERVPGVGGSNVKVTRAAFWVVVRQESCSQKKHNGVTTGACDLSFDRDNIAAMRMLAQRTRRGISSFRTDPTKFIKELPVAGIISQTQTYDTQPIDIVSPVGFFNSGFSW